MDRDGTNVGAVRPIVVTLPCGNAGSSCERKTELIGLLSKLRRRPKQREASATEAAIAWDPALLARLEAQHEELNRLTERLQACADEQAFDTIPVLLSQMRHALVTHLAEEHNRLYAFLAAAPESALLSHADIEASNANGRRIANTTRSLCRHFLETGVNRANADEFRQALAAIRLVMAKHLEREEERLYARYRQLAPENR